MPLPFITRRNRFEVLTTISRVIRDNYWDHATGLTTRDNQTLETLYFAETSRTRWAQSARGEGVVSFIIAATPTERLLLGASASQSHFELDLYADASICGTWRNAPEPAAPGAAVLTPDDIA